MSQHECPVVRVTIEPHPNADAIELARVGGYLSIVKKGQFKTGDLAVYLPEQSVIPDWLLKVLGFWDDTNGKGKLSGSRGDRIRAMKLRGILSQGILLAGVRDTYGDEEEFNELEMVRVEVPVLSGEEFLIRTTKREGDNLAEFLGVTKYEPVVPASMAGRVAGGDLDATIGYDFENIKKHPQLFQVGERVTITEKIHGTCLQVGIIPRRIWEGKSWADKCPDIGDGFKGIVTSKGQGAKGLMLDPGDEGNLYVMLAREQGLWEKLELVRTQELHHPNDQPLFIFGEIFGRGVQDLEYGQSSRVFRAFDMYVGTRSDGFFLSDELFVRSVFRADIPVVPLLYQGPYSPEILESLTDGKTMVLHSLSAGNMSGHIREGVVVKADGNHPKYGRRIAKSISEAYLLRKNPNATEFQ